MVPGRRCFRYCVVLLSCDGSRPRGDDARKRSIDILQRGAAVRAGLSRHPLFARIAVIAAFAFVVGLVLLLLALVRRRRHHATQTI